MLIERELELAVLERALEQSLGGRGQVVLVQAGAGLGKSELLATAGDLASAAGMQVRRASGHELERDFPFAAAVQLFETDWPTALPGLPHRTAGEPTVPGGADAFAVTHGLFALVRGICEPGAEEVGALALLVDDLHWLDRPSLGFLAYLAARMSDLPVVLMGTIREGASPADPAALTAIRAAMRLPLLRPGRLSADGVATVVREAFPDSGDGLARACAQATGGSPFLLAELLRELGGAPARDAEAAAAPVEDLLPESILHHVAQRLAQLPAEAADVAAAVAVLGGWASPGQAARVAGVDIDTATRCADLLAGADLLLPGAPLAFAQPLLARAVAASLSELRRGELLRRAAALYAQEGDVMDEEDPAPPSPQAPQAADAAAGAHGRDDAATNEPPAVATAAQASGRAQRRVVAEMALQRSLHGDSRREVRDLVERAWAGASRQAIGPQRQLAALLGRALLFVDDLERGLDIMGPAGQRGLVAPGPTQGWILYHQGRVADALAVTEAAGPDPPARMGGGESVAALAAGCHLAQGRQAAAEAELLAAHPDDDESDPTLLEVRAQLRLMQLEPRGALEDAMEAGRRWSVSFGSGHPGILGWRGLAALARLALGQRGEARALAEEELELAQTRGLTRLHISSLRVMGLAQRGAEGVDLLNDAVNAGSAGGVRLQYVEALVDLGAALRRSNQRAAARQPLNQAFELARDGGVTALCIRAREELQAAGTQPRRALLTGVDALTPSELRVAELAAQGRTTRQIAGALFVTPKTVEFHLRHVYRKLDVASTRAELTRVLRAAAESGADPE